MHLLLISCLWSCREAGLVHHNDSNKEPHRSRSLVQHHWPNPNGSSPGHCAQCTTWLTQSIPIPPGWWVEWLVSHWLCTKLYGLVSHQPLVCLLSHCGSGKRSQQVLASVDPSTSISLKDIKCRNASSFTSISSLLRKPPIFWKAIWSIMPCFLYIECPHSSKPLWCETPSSKGGAEVLVGGSLRFTLCQLWWASPTSQLHRVIMSTGQIHFHGLQLSIVYLKNSGMREGQLSALLIGQNKTLLSCFPVGLWIPSPSVVKLRWLAKSPSGSCWQSEFAFWLC